MTSKRSPLPIPPDRPAEEGSAYMIVLMLLFVLTIVGVGLSIVTQTEIIVGSNERSIQRVFYAADSGIGVATARVLQRNDLSAFVFDVKGSASNAAADVNAVDRIGVYPIVPIDDEFCNLCMINQGNEYFKINYAVTVEATRLIGEKGVPKDPVKVVEEEIASGGGGGLSTGQEGAPVASKSLTVMVEIQPLEAPSNDDLLISADPAVRQAVLSKIQF